MSTQDQLTLHWRTSEIIGELIYRHLVDGDFQVPIHLLFNILLRVKIGGNPYKTTLLQGLKWSYHVSVSSAGENHH